MTMYGKVTGVNEVEELKTPLVFEGKKYYNPNFDTLKAAGYKPVFEATINYSRMGYCKRSRKVTEKADSIEIDYIYQFIPESGKLFLKDMLRTYTRGLLETNVCDSGLGFNVNARPEDIVYVSTLIDETDSKSDVDFRDAENKFQNLTKLNLKKIRSAIFKSIRDIKEKKWDMESRIDKITTLEEFDTLYEQIETNF